MTRYEHAASDARLIFRLCVLEEQKKLARQIEIKNKDFTVRHNMGAADYKAIFWKKFPDCKPILLGKAKEIVRAKLTEEWEPQLLEGHNRIFKDGAIDLTSERDKALDEQWFSFRRDLLAREIPKTIRQLQDMALDHPAVKKMAADVGASMPPITTAN